MRRRETVLNSSFCVVTADSKSRWPHGRKTHFRGVTLTASCSVSLAFSASRDDAAQALGNAPGTGRIQGGMDQKDHGTASIWRWACASSQYVTSVGQRRMLGIWKHGLWTDSKLLHSNCRSRREFSLVCVGCPAADVTYDVRQTSHWNGAYSLQTGYSVSQYSNGSIRVSGDVSTLPSLRPNPSPTPNLTQGRVGAPQGTWIDPLNLILIVNHYYSYCKSL